jgi:hypothetical protein
VSFRIVHDDSILIPWAERLMGVNLGATAHAIGQEIDGVITGVAAFDNFSLAGCHMHMAVIGPIHRTTLFHAFGYPFLQLNLRRVTGLVSAARPDIIALDEKLGFKREGVMRNGLPNADLVVLGMLREECRFLNKRFIRTGVPHG